MCTGLIFEYVDFRVKKIRWRKKCAHNTWYGAIPLKTVYTMAWSRYIDNPCVGMCPYTKIYFFSLRFVHWPLVRCNIYCKIEFPHKCDKKTQSQLQEVTCSQMWAVQNELNFCCQHVSWQPYGFWTFHVTRILILRWFFRRLHGYNIRYE